MSRTNPEAGGATAGATAELLAAVAAADTVYADVYLRRAREVLSGVLSQEEYRARERMEQEIREAVRQGKTAAMLQDWQRAAAVAEQADRLRREASATAELAELGAKVYDAAGVAVDPFSPGFDALPGFNPDLPGVRDTLTARLTALADADRPFAALYESRRAFFAALTLAAAPKGGETAKTKSREELEQLAEQAAARGDMAQLKSYAQEILQLKAKEQAAGAAQPEKGTATAGRLTYRCPIDLAAPFPEAAVERAQALGLTAARTEPLPQAEPLLDFVSSRVWESNLAAAETEQEGAMRAGAIVDEVGYPPELAESVKVLVGQFLRNPFVNSGGARYLPTFRAESVLVEEFGEDGEPPATGELLSALDLPRQRGLARQEIDDALLQRGGAVVQERLQLDPHEFRLVCIPQDLFTRLGRDRGWGARERWTHFDGYQVLRTGALRALVGGDVRYGGVTDLASIAINDRRETVIARFAVIRRARQVARWR